MPTYDTDYLIDQVKRRASMPTSQNLFTNDKLIVMLNDELKTNVVPTLMSLRDEWYLTYTDYTTDGTTTTYAIPTGAIGNKLRNVTIWDNGKQVRTLQRLDYNDLQNALFGFYVENNNIIIYPTPIDANKTLRLAYFKRSDDLVATSESGYISNITGLDLTISTTPPTTFITGVNVQIVNNNNPFNIIWEGSISNVVGSTITLDSTPTGASIGNYLCLSGETIFPNIPVELYPLLCQAVVVKCLEALGDTEGMNVALGILNQIGSSAKNAITPKIDGSPKRLINKYSIGRFV